MKAKYLILIMLVPLIITGCASDRTKKVKAYLTAKKEQRLSELTVAFCDKLNVIKKGMTFEEVSQLGPLLLEKYGCEPGKVFKRSFRSVVYTFDTQCRLQDVEVKIDCTDY